MAWSGRMDEQRVVVHCSARGKDVELVLKRTGKLSGSLLPGIPGGWTMKACLGRAGDCCEWECPLGMGWCRVVVVRALSG